MKRLSKYINSRKYDTGTSRFLARTDICVTDFRDEWKRYRKAHRIWSAFEGVFGEYFNDCEEDAVRRILQFLPTPEEPDDGNLSDNDIEFFEWWEELYETPNGGYFRALVFGTFYIDALHNKRKWDDVEFAALLPFVDFDDACDWACDNLTADKADKAFGY